VTFSELVAEMVAFDLKEAARDYLCAEAGFEVCRHLE
jgi:hypothetical protein